MYSLIIPVYRNQESAAGPACRVDDNECVA